MSLFRKASANVALIDVRSSSIGAAFATLAPNSAPRLVYSTRVPLDPHATEPMAETLPRTLESALKGLVTEGAPALRAASGSGRVDRVLVTFTAPWQHSEVSCEIIEKERPFVFTKELLDSALARHTTRQKGRQPVSNMIIATLLNGYEVEKPFGKRVKRAELILLSSSIEAEIMDMASKMVRKALHQPHIEFNAFLPEAFGPLREIYPHQPDFLMLDIGGDATDVLLVKHGLLISTSCLAQGVNGIVRAARSMGVSSPVVDMTRAEEAAPSSSLAEAEKAWISSIHESLAAVAKQEPLPRSILLMAEEHVRDFLRSLLDAPALRNLLLSDESLAVLPVLPTQFIPFIEGLGTDGADPALALLALAAARRFA